MNVAAWFDSPLTPLDAARVAVLEWSQPKRFRQRVWKLSADGTPVAVLRWRGPFRRGYDARTAAGDFHVRSSFWGRHRIRHAGDETILAESRWKGIFRREVTRAAGDSLVWRGEGWTGATHVLENREQFPMFRVRRQRAFLALTGRVELEEAARTLPDLIPLLLLGWSLVIDRARQRAR